MFSLLYSPEVLPTICSIRRKEAGKEPLLLGYVVKQATTPYMFRPQGASITDVELSSIADFVREYNRGKASR